ncbi:hypothetical protein X777_05968 [Ooceraea biroi]|uniref:Uncharacterized protein n=1 Tax=Ooceraea biroi TaxID=2015173 RepID=A0A026WDY0_OOCBI|nr:hypothetical protein X777_05968 [Ooceraea biroi]
MHIAGATRALVNSLHRLIQNDARLYLYNIIVQVALKSVRLKPVWQNETSPQYLDRRAHAGWSDRAALIFQEFREGELPVPTPAITFSFSACTVLEFMPDGELMRDRFVVITRRRRRRDGKSRKTSGLASLSPRERAATVGGGGGGERARARKQETEDGEGRR